MEYILDTNIIIAYIFAFDGLNNSSNEFLSQKFNFYYTFHVKKEVKRVFRRKYLEYAYFLTKIHEIIEDYDDNSLVDFLKIHRQINNFKNIGHFSVNNMHSALDIIMDNLDFSENSDAYNVKLNFFDFEKNFYSHHHRLKNKCFDEFKFIPKYEKKEQIILDKIEEKSLRKYLHEEDEDILFDANEYVKNNNLDFSFVSADEDFIKVIANLLEFLSIKSYYHLKNS